MILYVLRVFQKACTRGEDDGAMMAEIQNVRRAKFRSFPFTSHVRAKCYAARYITVHKICDVHRSVYYNIDVCVYILLLLLCICACAHYTHPVPDIRLYILYILY